ncbi:hypothetical protein GOQ04_01050 [Emticicia sp. ODNR4P]|nr:hypothetical protein [Emticicia sp. ODNR4P]
METLTPVYLRLLKANFEHLVQCFTEQESLTGQTGLILKLRAEDILSNSLSQALSTPEVTDENLQWVREAVMTYLRFYPENITSSNLATLDDEIDMILHRIMEIAEHLE